MINVGNHLDLFVSRRRRVVDDWTIEVEGTRGHADTLTAKDRVLVYIETTTDQFLEVWAAHPALRRLINWHTSAVNKFLKAGKRVR